MQDPGVRSLLIWSSGRSGTWHPSRARAVPDARRSNRRNRAVDGDSTFVVPVRVAVRTRGFVLLCPFPPGPSSFWHPATPTTPPTSIGIMQARPRWRRLPLVLLISGVAFGAATIVTACLGLNVPAVVLGACGAVAAIGLTFIIAQRQDAETKGLQDVVEQMHQLLRDVAERDSAQDYTPALTATPAAEAPLDDIAPSYREEAIEALRAHGANLDFDHLLWRQKKPMRDLRGNHGWFVETEGNPADGRWFVRKARGMTVRKAMPRELLESLEGKAQLDPREIKLDFQTKEHGLAAWYARTYSGDLWKVWRSNRKPGVRVEKVETSDEG